jgi:hypothetical protein
MGTSRGLGIPTNPAPIWAGRFGGPFPSSRRVPPACAERYALGMSNAEALPRIRRFMADEKGNEGGQQKAMDRFGVTAGRAGVDLTVGALTSPRRRVEIRELGQARRAHRVTSRGGAAVFWALFRSARILRTSRSKDSSPTRFPSESTKGRRRDASRVQVSGCSRTSPRGGPGRTRPTVRWSIEDAASPNPFARIRNERYECAQSISAFPHSRYNCDAGRTTEAEEEGPPEGLRRGPDRAGLLRGPREGR